MQAFFIPVDGKYSPLIILREKKNPFLLKFYVTAYPLRYDEAEAFDFFSIFASLRSQRIVSFQLHLIS